MKKRKIFMLILLIILFLISALILSFFYVNYKVENFYNNKIFTLENVKSNKVGLVLGAGTPYGNISGIYEDRLKVAANAYKAKKVEKILVSGDNGSLNYNELTPAKLYLVKNGVKKEDVFLDYAGFDTYQSIYRARDIFGNKNLTIFTQEFHLKRALYICDGLNIDCVGVHTDLNKYKYSGFYNYREKLARFKAFLNIHFKSKPKYLGEKININEDSNFD